MSLISSGTTWCFFFLFTFCSQKKLKNIYKSDKKQENIYKVNADIYNC